MLEFSILNKTQKEFLVATLFLKKVHGSFTIQDADGSEKDYWTSVIEVAGDHEFVMAENETRVGIEQIVRVHIIH